MSLESVKNEFIVPSVIRCRDLYYCPFRSSRSVTCIGVFTSSEVGKHLKSVHEKTPDEIDRLLEKGFPRVPPKRWAEALATHAAFSSKEHEQYTVAGAAQQMRELGMSIHDIGKVLGISYEWLRQQTSQPGSGTQK